MREIHLPFQPDMKKAILDNKKTCTSRTVQFGQPGDWFFIDGHKCILESVEFVPLSYVANRLFEKEGFVSPMDFIRKWSKIHFMRGYDPSQSVWVHEFKRET